MAIKKMTNNQKLATAIALTLVTYILVPTKASAAIRESVANDANTLPKNQKPIIITDLDALWNYKLENGVWYTQRKNSTTWVDMKSSLSAANYTAAVKTLTNYIAAKY